MTTSRSGTLFNCVPTTMFSAPARPPRSYRSSAHLTTNCPLLATPCHLVEHCTMSTPEWHWCATWRKGKLVTQGERKCLETVMSSWHNTINGTKWHTLNLSTSEMLDMFYLTISFLLGRFAECPLYKHWNCSRNPWDKRPNIASSHTCWVYLCL